MKKNVNILCVGAMILETWNKVVCAAEVPAFVPTKDPERYQLLPIY